VSAADAVVAFFHAVDDRDWPAVRAGLAEEVATDYTSLFGGEPERLAADALVERWRGLLPGFDATQHLLGPLVPSGTTVECNVRGYHHLDGRTWMVAGRYTLTLHGEKVAGIVLHTAYQEGDKSLVEEATARA
jgi:SnoaL-like protein